MKRQPFSIQSRISDFITMAGSGFLILGILSNPLVSEVSRDSGIFLYIGSLILKGKMPYLAAWENKGPLIFYINALGLFLADGSRWGIWLMEFLFLFVTGWIFHRLSRRLFGELASTVGTFIWILAAGSVLQGGNLSEEYALPFSMAAAWLYWKSVQSPATRLHPFLLGISLGLSVLLRPNNIGMHLAITAAFVLQAFLSREFALLFKRAILIASGVVLVILPVCAYFAFRGALTEMIKVAVLFNMQYSDSSNPARVVSGILSGMHLIGLPLIVLSLLGFILALIDLIKKNSPVRDFTLLLVLGWPLEAILSTLSGRNYPHYFILWAPHMGLLSSYLVYRVLSQWQLRWEKYAIAFTLAGLLVFGFARSSSWRGYGQVFHLWRMDSTSNLDLQYPIAGYIREKTSPNEKVLIWGFRPVLYFASGREAPASFLPYPLIHVDTPLGYSWAEQFFNQFTSNPPVMIVDVVNFRVDPIPSLDESLRRQQRRLFKGYIYAPNLDRVFEFISQNYKWMGVFDGYTVYQLIRP